MNQGWTYRDRVRTDGETVLDYYRRRYRHSSEAEWRSRIEQGLILLAGEPVEAQQVLAKGQHLTYRRLPWEEPVVPLDFEVLYEDADVWAISKPVGLPVLPGGGCLEHTVLWLMRSRYPNDQPAPLHRLGRGTSGVMLVARSARAKSDLSRQFRVRSQRSSSGIATGSMRKIYRALVGPATVSDLPDRFVCEQAIGKIPYPRLGYIYGHLEGGLHACSKGQVLERRADSTLVEVQILTGRPHQIRIHLAAVGYPLLGDPLYGVGGVPRAEGTAIPSDCGYRLHAHRVQFDHPRSGEVVSVVASLPEDLRVCRCRDRAETVDKAGDLPYATSTVVD